LLDFFLLVVLVSASGALSPGPLFIATVDSAIKNGRYAGFAVAFGHMVFELPLVVAIGFGIWSFISDPLIKSFIGILGAAALIAFGVAQAYSSSKRIFRENAVNDDEGFSRLKPRKAGLFNAFLVGLVFTALNPYFLMWWFTIGLSLIAEAIRLSAIAGIFVMFAFHIWLDYAWLGFTGYATAVGSKALKPRQINLISLILDVIIVIAGIMLLQSVVTAL